MKGTLDYLLLKDRVKHVHPGHAHSEPQGLE